MAPIPASAAREGRRDLLLGRCRPDNGTDPEARNPSTSPNSGGIRYEDGCPERNMTKLGRTVRPMPFYSIDHAASAIMTTTRGNGESVTEFRIR